MKTPIPQILAAAMLAGLPLTAAAQPAPVAAPTPDAAPTPTVDEFSVTPVAQCLQPRLDPLAPAPHVVSTYPADGTVVRPGLLVMRVTFDVPMSCKGFFTAMAPFRNPCPSGRQVWTVSFDRLTIRTVCNVEAGRSYGVQMSDQPDSRFFSLDGKSLDPFRFNFATSLAAPIVSVSDSLDQDPFVNPPPPEFQPISVLDNHFKH